MSTNYSIVKESEKELTKHFFVFYKHVYNSWKKLDDVLANKQKIDDYDLEDFLVLEHRSNRYEAELLDECIWNISSNQPMAQHLRFIVSIIYSISDLERMADYVINCAKFINVHTPNNKTLPIIQTSIHNNLLTMDKIVNLLKNQDNLKKHWITTYRKTIKYQREFKTAYQELIKKLSLTLVRQQKATDISAILNGLFLVLKNNERNVDHCVNLIENFIYIRNSDFFHNKKSKQGEPKVQQKIETAMEILPSDFNPSGDNPHKK